MSEYVMETTNFNNDIYDKICSSRLIFLDVFEQL